MKNINKQHFILVAFGVILFVALNHLSSLFWWFGNVLTIIMPIILGFILAFILNVPMRGIEKIIDKLKKDKDKEINLKLKRTISFSITMICLIGIILLVSFLVFPKLVDSIISIYNLINKEWANILLFFEEYGFDSTVIQEWFDSLNIQKIISILSSDDFNAFDVLFNFVGSTLSGLASFLISLVIAIYILIGKEDLTDKSRKMVTVYCSEKKAKNIFHITKLIDEKYTKFLTGQCLEACILGGLMFMVLTILRIPYASMLAMLAALFAFVPYIGAFLSCGIGVILIAILSPVKALIYLVAYLIIQFIETQLIYPHVVGTSVGLNALWTIIAVFIGGELFGLFGMIFFIPLVAVVITLINEHTEKKIQENNTIQIKTEEN